MIVSLTIIRYPKKLIPVALLAMGLHRFYMRRQKGCSFWKMLGSGRDGTFSLNPDWQQWGLLATWNERSDFDAFNQSSPVSKWWARFATETYTLLCKPLQSHGEWDGQQPFGDVNEPVPEGPVAILTRATIRFNKLGRFWAHVDETSQLMSRSPGYILSFGIGEMPFYRQATFSVWQSIEDVKKFAYGAKEHAEVVRKTREENWYSEELFARFKLIGVLGVNKGNDPLKGKIIK